MTERSEWRLDQLEELDRKKSEVSTDHNQRIRSLESFRDSTVEKLITIFKAIEDIKEGNEWMKRAITKTLITAVIGAVISVLVWAIQN